MINFKNLGAPHITLAIDATNLSIGGGVTHIIELLNNSTPPEFKIDKVIIWGLQNTLKKINDSEWLIKRSPFWINQGIIKRYLWKTFVLPKLLRKYKVDLLFVPGGSYLGRFKPSVVMCRNMLPFNWKELFKYGISFKLFKLIILRYIHLISFKKNNGVIFLNDFAKKNILQYLGKLNGKDTIIHHGLSKRFIHKSRECFPIQAYSKSKPFKLIYVSDLEPYKHHWNVVSAVSLVRDQTGWPIELNLVGRPRHKPSSLLLEKAISKYDPSLHWINLFEKTPYEKLHELYKDIDLGIFASTCENFPNIILEYIGCSLPFICSNRPPMPSITENLTYYFDPEDPQDISEKVVKIINNYRFRKLLSLKLSKLVTNYSWEECSRRTFSFLYETFESYS